MKVLVNSLPYYNDSCPFESKCHDENCPRGWDKSFVTSDDNPRECELLKELGAVGYGGV